MLWIKEYYILISLSIIPFIYKYLFWIFVIQLKEYRLDRFFDYIKTPQWIKAIFQFLFFIDAIILILFSVFLLNTWFEKYFQIILFILLWVENLFIFWRIIKKRLFKPKITWRLALTLIIILFIIFAFFILIKNIYIFLLTNFIFSPVIILLAIFISSPIITYLKNKKYKKASEITKRYNDIIKIWITWSYWKTSTKEYLMQILNHKYNLLATPDNINTEVWVSDVIINKLNNKYDVFIAEMWAYKIGEIETIWKIVDQKYGFITAIWNQHLGLFWWLKKIKKAKSEIAIKVLENKWILYINWDNKNIRDLKFDKKLKVVRYWTKKGSDARSEVLEKEEWSTIFKFKYKKIKLELKTNLIWTHNIQNLTWVLALCIDLWFKKEEIQNIIQNLKTPKNTLELTYTNSNVILNDTYNLSEWSIFAWLETMNSFKNAKEKVLIIDDILELWKKSRQIHYDIGKKVAKEKLATKIVYVWVNYRKDFINGLVDWWFNISSIYYDLSFIEKWDVLLFEWRKSQILLNKFLWKKQS